MNHLPTTGLGFYFCLLSYLSIAAFSLFFFFKICEILIKSGLFVTGCVADFQNAEESGFCLVLLCVDEAEDIKRRAQMA